MTLTAEMISRINNPTAFAQVRFKSLSHVRLEGFHGVQADFELVPVQSPFVKPICYLEHFKECSKSPRLEYTASEPLNARS